MSIEQLAMSLPNGLHDAELVGLHADYVGRTVVLRVNIDISSSEDLAGASDPMYRPATLEFRDVQFVVIDPPSTDGAVSGPLAIEAGDGQPNTAPIAVPTLAQSAFICWFYIENSNSFVRIAARSVSMQWSNAPTNPSQTDA